MAQPREKKSQVWNRMFENSCTSDILENGEPPRTNTHQIFKPPSRFAAGAEGCRKTLKEIFSNPHPTNSIVTHFAQSFFTLTSKSEKYATKIARRKNII